MDWHLWLVTTQDITTWAANLIIMTVVATIVMIKPTGATWPNACYIS